MEIEPTLRAIKQVKAAAKAVASLSSGLVAGCQQLRGSIGLLPPELRPPHPAIDALLEAVPTDVVLGENLLYRSDQDLVRTTQVLASIESIHRLPVLRECKAIYLHCSQLQSGSSRAPNRSFKRTPDGAA